MSIIICVANAARKPPPPWLTRAKATCRTILGVFLHISFSPSPEGNPARRLFASKVTVGVTVYIEATAHNTVP
jgi:hypothetical protein